MRAFRDPGSTRVPRVGEGVPPWRTSCGVASGLHAPKTRDAAGSPFRRDAETNTRDACAPRILLLTALLLFATFSRSRATEPDTFSPIVSYQYLDTLAEPTTTITSPVVSYQYLDWPGDENLTFTNSPNVSYYFDGPPRIVTQPLAATRKTGETAEFSVVAEGSALLTYQWRVNGVNLPGASGAAIAIDQLKLSDAGAYSVVVQNGYGSVVSNDVRLTVYLPAVDLQPAVPVMRAATQLPSTGQTIGPAPVSHSEHLKIMSNGGVADPQRMTIVMTHGWRANWLWDEKRNAEAWPTAMAFALDGQRDGSGRLLRDSANVIAWDWENDAKLGSVIDPSKAAGQTLKQGEALGKALVAALGSNYDKPIHFLGHSLGTMVNCRAIDYLHGHAPKGRPVIDATAFSPARMHLTLFDEAEIAGAVQGLRISWDVILSGLGSDTATNDGATQIRSFAKVLPETVDRLAWVDNYISEVGWLHRQAANVLLFRRLAVPGISDFFGRAPGLHGYSYDWYLESIKTPLPPGLQSGENAMGFFWSFERRSLQNAYAIGTFYEQSVLLNASPLRLESLSWLEAHTKSLDRLRAYATKQKQLAQQATAQRVEAVIQDGIQYGRTMVADIKESFSQPRGEAVYVGAGSTPAYYTSVAPAPPPQAHWDFEFNLSPGAPSPQELKIPMRATAVAADQSGTGPAYTILPVHVPLEAVGVSFEYAITGAADDDFMVMGVGEENSFSMEARYVGEGEWNASPVILIAELRDQDIQLVFVLNGANGAPAGSLSVRNIQFYIPPRPQLTLSSTNHELTVSWPNSAIGWTLESAADLRLPNPWQAEAGLPEVDDDFQSMTFDISTTPKAFFRLKK